MKRLYSALAVTGAALLAAAMATTTAAGMDGDAERPVIVGKVWNSADTTPQRPATQADVNRLKRLKTKPSVKCARIEYVQQCLSNQNMTLRRVACRPGSTEASCCKGVRDHVTTKICGPLWDRLKKAGKSYSPGIWLCKCLEQPRTLRRKLKPGRPSTGAHRYPPDPVVPPEPIIPPEPVKPGKPQ